MQLERLIYPFCTPESESNDNFIVGTSPGTASTQTMHVHWIRRISHIPQTKVDAILDESASCSNCAFCYDERFDLEGFDFGVLSCDRYELPLNIRKGLDSIICPEWSSITTGPMRMNRDA